MSDMDGITVRTIRKIVPGKLSNPLTHAYGKGYPRVCVRHRSERVSIVVCDSCFEDLDSRTTWQAASGKTTGRRPFKKSDERRLL
jgi:hypothetical protein